MQIWSLCDLYNRFAFTLRSLQISLPDLEQTWLPVACAMWHAACGMRQVAFPSCFHLYRDCGHFPCTFALENLITVWVACETLPRPHAYIHRQRRPLLLNVAKVFARATLPHCQQQEVATHTHTHKHAYLFRSCDLIKIKDCRANCSRFLFLCRLCCFSEFRF